MQQTLKGFTMDAAVASFQERRVGSIEVGKEADFVVLGADLTRIGVEEIKSVVRKATIVGGRILHGRLN